MWAILRYSIYFILVFFCLQDWVTTTIQGFVGILRNNSYFVLSSFFIKCMVIYVSLHCIPFRLLLPKQYREKNVDHDINQLPKSFTNDEECVVFDPDNIHESSTNLSDFLKCYQRDDWTPKAPNKLRKTAWVWTDDEKDMDTNSPRIVSLPDIGYLTKSKSFSSDSKSEHVVVPRRREVKKQKLRTRKVVVHAYEDKTDSCDDTEAPGCSNAKFECSAQDNMDSMINITSGQGVVNLDQDSDTCGLTNTCVLKYSMIAVGVGLGAYLVYKVYTKK